MDSEEVAAVRLSKEVVEDLIDHDVVPSVPPVRRAVVDCFHVHAQTAEECYEAVGSAVWPREEHQDGL